MTPLHRHHRRGMTLVELLVVIAIIGLLSAAVLPNLAGSAGPRKVRETARSVSSFLAGAQSQAIGSRTGAGIWIDLLANPIVDDAGVAHAVALDLALCDVPTPYSGELSNSLVNVIPDSVPASSTATLAFLPDATTFFPPSTTNLFIRFGTSQNLFLLAQAGGSWQAQMDLTRNQQPYNTVWPVTSSQGVSYEVMLPPTKNPVRSLTVETEMVIDLTWTFLGVDDGSWPPCDPTAAIAAGGLDVTAPVLMLYNPTGKPTSVASNGGVGVTMLEPLYLLVTSIEAIQESTAFTTSRSYWVAVDPSGGIPRVAEVQPISLLDPSLVLPTNRAQLEFTQQFIRDASLQVGG
jgi:prepilin-type N-terminal cleavage/methylation domain-containing protein